jgi:hypothetical protein
MSGEPIIIEESEAKVLNPRDPSDSLYIEMQPSPKADRIRREGLVVYKGERYSVSTQGETGDAGGGPERFILLKVNRQAGGAASRG